MFGYMLINYIMSSGLSSGFETVSYCGEDVGEEITSVIRERS